MISFRVSEQEFEMLRSKSEAVGARSVSDYARLALCNAARARDGEVGSDVQQLSGEIQQLSLDIRRLTEFFDGPGRPYTERPTAPSNNNGGLRNG